MQNQKIINRLLTLETIGEQNNYSTSVCAEGVSTPSNFLNEAWVAYKGYEGRYEISNTGMVKSLPFGRILKPTVNEHGYESVQLSINNKAKRVLVHRLVAITFIDKIEGKESVNHIDGNKTNNHVSNLEWVTTQENSIHASYMGLLKTRSVIDTITNVEYQSIIKAANSIGIPHQTLYHYLKGDRKNKTSLVWK